LGGGRGEGEEMNENNISMYGVCNTPNIRGPLVTVH